MTHIRDPEVSVLMSCYNASRWLHEAIDSVLVQTYDNFELILVDDGSTDETWNIIQSYGDRDQRIVAISKRNTGLADSLNVGIAKGRGTWVARLDADDLCEPARLEEQIRFVQKHPKTVLLGTGFVEIDGQGQVIDRHLYPSGHRKLVRHLELLLRFFPHSAAFYRADVARRVGGYNLRIKRAEDWRLWLNLALEGQIACLPDFLVRVRKHSGQISSDNNHRRQICDGVAATVCYLLRKAGRKDPSVEGSSDEWIAFLNWLENRIEETDTFERRMAWIHARAALVVPKNMMIGALRFGARLVQSGYASALVWEQLFGLSLPERLAREWMKRSCAAS